MDGGELMPGESLTVTVEEAAKMLGIGRQLGYELARSGRLPVLRLGNRYVVPRAQLLRMVGEADGSTREPAGV
jgi:excisionase family DNA binding protein